MHIKNRLIVALDVETYDEASDLVDLLSPEVEVFKIGMAPFTGFGDAIIEKIHSLGKKVFLDLKFHDIPNTVKNVSGIAVLKKVFMMNFHCLGGGKMLRFAAEGVAETAEKNKIKAPILLGVTVLTSMGQEDLEEIGIRGTVENKVEDFVELAKKNGMNGVVASAKEIKRIKEIAGKDFVVVTPGIRPAWAVSGDQKRIVTPAQAIKDGADYIVVGRPIIKAEDPLDAAKRIIEEMGGRDSVSADA